MRIIMAAIIMAFSVITSGCTNGYVCSGEFHETACVSAGSNTRLHEYPEFAKYMIDKASFEVGLDKKRRHNLTVLFVDEANWGERTTVCPGEDENLIGCAHGTTAWVLMKDEYTSPCQMMRTLVHEFIHIREGIPAGHKDPYIWGENYPENRKRGEAWRKGVRARKECWAEWNRLTKPPVGGSSSQAGSGVGFSQSAGSPWSLGQ